jgi:hypothetical protein
MKEAELFNKLLFYIIYITSVIFLLITFISGSFYLIIISSGLLLLSLIYLHSGHIVNNYLIKKSKIIEISNNYTLSSSLNSVFKRKGTQYVGISMAEIKQYGQSNISSESMKSLIEAIHEPFEFSIYFYELDKEKLLEPLETKKKMKEISLTKINENKQDKINLIKREIEILNSEIENIRSSPKSFDVSILIKSFSISNSEGEAVTQSFKTIQRIADTFSASLKLEYEIIRGEKLLEFFS